MSNRKSATATKAPAEHSTDRLQVDCDVAREIISQYLAISAKQLSAEKKQQSPDLEKVRVLEARIRELYQEQMRLGTDTADLINKAFTCYAQVVKAARA